MTTSPPDIVERIYIKGFKSIREVDLELKPLNVLIGANGAGKSNFIEIFRLTNALIQQRLQEYVARAGGAERLLHFGSKTTDQIEFQFWSGEYFYNLNLTPDKRDRLFYTEKHTGLHVEEYETPNWDVFRIGDQEIDLADTSDLKHYKISPYVLFKLRNWRVYHFHDTSPEAKVKKASDLHDNEFLRPDAANLAAFLYLLQETQPAHYQQIVRVVQLVAPFFRDFRLRPNPLNENTIRLQWEEKGSDSYFDASDFSDGTLRFICLATLMLQPVLPYAIIIDEPELGLHPYAISQLAALMRRAATKTQVIVSTQSVTLVNQFTPDDIVVVDRTNEGSTFRRLGVGELDVWLEEYGLGDLWEKNLLGGRP